MWHLQQSVARLDAASPASPAAIPAGKLAETRLSTRPEPRLQASLDCRHPELGLTEWRVGVSPLPTNLGSPSTGIANGIPLPATVAIMRFLGPMPLEANTRLVEAYVRGADLVVEYGENPDGDRCELYYRALPCRSLDPRESRSEASDPLTRHGVAGTVYGGVELWVSVQTRTLDSRPRVGVGNLFPAGTQVLTAPDWPERGLRVFRLPGIQLSYVESVYPADVADDASLADTKDNAGLVTTWAGLNVVWMEKGVIRRCRVRGWWVAREGDLEIAAALTQDFLADAPPLTA